MREVSTSDMQGTGRRNAHLLVIAPNANSSIIVSTSPSIELMYKRIHTQNSCWFTFGKE